MRKILVAIFIICLVCLIILAILKGMENEKMGAELTSAEKVEALKNSLTQIPTVNGKYTQILLTENKDLGLKYEVTEYQSPKGNGYQVIIYDEKERKTISQGYGPEAEWRTWTENWPAYQASSTK